MEEQIMWASITQWISTKIIKSEKYPSCADTQAFQHSLVFLFKGMIHLSKALNILKSA